MAVPILMVKELRSKDPADLKAYKAEVNKARLQASTEFEREAYANQLERVNTILNEVEATKQYLALQEKRFVQLEKEIDQVIMLGEAC